MTSICFLAQFPPPIHGLSKAVETLYNSRLKEKYNFSKIDITSNKRIVHTLLALLRCKNDIIYFTPSQTCGGNLRDLLFLKVIQWRKKRCIVHIHGGYFRQLIDKDVPAWQKTMDYEVIKGLAGGIVLGHSLHGIFEGMLSDDRIFVCPNCVDDAFIAPSIDDKLEEVKYGTKLHVLYLSNFIESKGYRDVLELARMAQDNGDGGKFVFHFAGKFFEPTEEVYFKEHSEGLKNVEFHGVVGGQVKVNLLKQCHIFSLLSRYPNEGQPISILEAMGNGMAIITTDHAGIPEIASHENGFACSKQRIQVDDIYGYLTDCYNQREKLVSACKLNYAKVKDKYTEKQYIDNMDEIFRIISKEQRM